MRSEMREIVAQEENNAILLRRDIPHMNRIVGLANMFRISIAEDQVASNGDAIDEFVQAFDDALGNLSGALSRAQDGDI
jgi:hypothetical protein